MSTITAAVDIINDALMTKVFSEEKYSTAQVLNIAYPFPEKKGSDTLIKIVPALIDNTGEAVPMIDINADAPLTMYHRITGKTYQYIQQQKQSFGDQYMQRCVADMYIIVCALRSAVLIPAEELESNIVMALPNNVLLSGTKRTLILPYASDLDFVRVFRQEFQQVDYFLSPSQILLQIKYKIQLDTLSNCIL